MAHEINNPAAYVIANLSDLETKQAEFGPRLEALRAARAEPDDARRLALYDAVHRDRSVESLLESERQLVAETLHGAQRIRAIAKTMKDFVREHGGTMDVVSQPGRGTTMTVWLDAVPSALRAPTPVTPVPAGPPRAAERLRVLVVDDEVLLLRALGRLLAANFDVTTAAGGAAAIALLQADSDRFDVVFSDLSMPEVSGMDLDRWLAEHRPALAARTVLMTGGAFSLAAREFLEKISNPRLDKPFSPEDASGVVSELLAPALAVG